MTTRLWMLIWLSQALSALSELPPPVNLTLTSSPLRHLFKWQPGPGTPTGVHYQVTIATDRATSWLPVAGCERVQYPLVCNLTGTFRNPRELHYVQVVAMKERQARPSRPAIYPGFIPITDIQLDLPLLSVTPCGQDLCVDLHPPLEQKRELYATLKYKLKIESNSADRAQFFKEFTSLKGEILVDLAPGRQYCVSVCITDLEYNESNYSQPVCASTSGIYTADQWLTAVLCVLVTFFLIIVALLGVTGVICLKNKPLPLVLTSTIHTERTLVLEPCSTSLSSLLPLKPTPPSSAEKRSKQPSDESDVESRTEGTDGSGQAYILKVDTNLLSFSSSPPSALSAPLSLEDEPRPVCSSNQTSDFFPTTDVPVSRETQCIAGLTQQTNTHAQSLMVGLLTETEKKEEIDSQDVNLLTLTFAIHEEEEEQVKLLIDPTEVEPESHSESEKFNMAPVKYPQFTDTKAVAIASEEEDNSEEELAGYMERPSTDILRLL